MVYRYFGGIIADIIAISELTAYEISSPDCDPNNWSTLSYWLTCSLNEMIVLFFNPPQSTDTLPPPSPSIPLPEVPLTGEPQEQALGRLSEFYSSLFTVILVFILPKHMLSHKAGILFLNCSLDHTSACQETVGGHAWSCGC